jgi:hypothetical protein
MRRLNKRVCGLLPSHTCEKDRTQTGWGTRVEWSLDVKARARQIPVAEGLD